MTPMRVLIIDDDDVDRERLRRMLSGADSRVEVIEAASANESLERLSDAEVDCVLLDYNLGDSLGTDLLGKLEKTSNKNCPVIMITGQANERTAIEAVRQGVYDYLPKASLDRGQLNTAIEGGLRWARLRSELRESEHRYQRQAMMLDLAHDPILAWSRQGGIEFWNRGCEQLYGYTAAEALGHSGHELLCTEFPVSRAAFESELLRTGLWSGEVRHTSKSGGVVVVSSRHQLIQIGDRALVLEANRDITVQKKVEELQLRSRKMESLGTLAGGIAHDFNNILLAISGHCTLAKEELPADHPVQDSLSEIGRASDRATQLVRRILLFARKEEPRRNVIPLEPIVSEALNLMRSSLPAMITLSFRPAPALRSVSADPTQIHQIVINLVTNAAHAIGSRRGAIEVSLDAVMGERLRREHPELGELHYIRLSVADDGCGIQPKDLKRIFDPFFTTKPVGQGTGLGLSAVHGIVTSHHGGIDVESTPSVGTTFKVYFPAISPVSDPEHPNDEPLEAGRGQRILYVDDESVVVNLMTTVLKRLGYRVTSFTDPEQALTAFRERPAEFEIVITDLSMPQLSGFELARALRAIRPDVPIVLTTGLLTSDDECVAKNIGIQRILLKPDVTSQLPAALAQIFAQAPHH